MTYSINELPLAITVIAEAAIWNVKESNKNFQAFDLKEMFAKIAPKLCERAAICYNENSRFRYRLKTAKDCRAVLLMDMQSWCLDLLKNNAPAPARIQKPMLRYGSHI